MISKNSNPPTITTLLSTLILSAVVASSAQAQNNAIIDGEDEYIDGNGALYNSSNALITGHVAGGNFRSPELTQFARMGSNAITFRTGKSDSEHDRSEYHIKKNVTMEVGSSYFHDFSVKLVGSYPYPQDWHVLHQIQQEKVPGQRFNNPFIHFSIDHRGSNKFKIRWTNGKNGDQPAEWIHKTIDDPKASPVERNVWYDFVIGWTFSPNHNDGSVWVYIKKGNETQYRQYVWHNAKVGYSDPAPVFKQSKIGIYMRSDGNEHVANFDEVRFATSRWGARIPGSTF